MTDDSTYPEYLTKKMTTFHLSDDKNNHYGQICIFVNDVKQN